MGYIMEEIPLKDKLAVIRQVVFDVRPPMPDHGSTV
jgi:hypothetical protein